MKLLIMVTLNLGRYHDVHIFQLSIAYSLKVDGYSKIIDTLRNNNSWLFLIKANFELDPLNGQISLKK